MNTPVYRMEPDNTETLVGFAGNVTEAILMIEEDRRKIDYDIGYHWKPPVEEECECHRTT